MVVVIVVVSWESAISVNFWRIKVNKCKWVLAVFGNPKREYNKFTQTQKNNQGIIPKQLCSTNLLIKDLQSKLPVCNCINPRESAIAFSGGV